jgi:hypothetical protein
LDRPKLESRLFTAGLVVTFVLVADLNELFPSSGAGYQPGTTLRDLFPGNSGRLHFVRIMLRLMHPGLDSFPWDQPLDMELLAKIQTAIEQDEKE